MTPVDVIGIIVLVVTALGFLAFDLFEARHGMHKR